jgi:hypothetical protein
MERQPERREILVGRRDRGQPLQDGAEVIAEEPDEAAEEGGCIGRDDDRPIETRHETPGDRERVGPRCRRFEDRDRVSRQVSPARVAARPRALEEDEARQVAERLGDVDGARFGDPIGKPAEAERSAGDRPPGHRPMIRPSAAKPVVRGAAVCQPAVTGAGFSIGTPIMLPYSVHEPS